MAEVTKNFAVSTVATAPSPASSGTSLVVAAGHGAGRFNMTPPFNAVVCPADAQPTPDNAEVVRVTARSTDTLTITRAQESSVARSIVVGDRIFAGVTAKTLSDLDTAIAAKQDSDATLAALAGASTAANKLAYFSGTDAVTVMDFTAAGRALLDDADAAAQRTTLSVYSTGEMDVIAATKAHADTMQGETGIYVPHNTHTAASAALVSNQLYAARFVPPRNMAVVSIAFVVSTGAGGATDAVEVGICTGSGTTLTKVQSSGSKTDVGPNAAGVKNVALTATANLTAGTTYYAFLVATNTASVMQASFVNGSSTELFGTTFPTVELRAKASVTPGIGATVTTVNTQTATAPMMALRES